jgi:hypothetical protein
MNSFSLMPVFDAAMEMCSSIQIGMVTGRVFILEDLTAFMLQDTSRNVLVLSSDEILASCYKSYQGKNEKKFAKGAGNTERMVEISNEREKSRKSGPDAIPPRHCCEG